MADSDRVIINDEVHYLRNDGTIHLGMTTSFCAVGSRRWNQTDKHGRATLIPGGRYITMEDDDAARFDPDQVPCLERLRNFMMRYI